MITISEDFNEESNSKKTPRLAGQEVSRRLAVDVPEYFFFNLYYMHFSTR